MGEFQVEVMFPQSKFQFGIRPGATPLERQAPFNGIFTLATKKSEK
jgi:hypothetical protein